MYHSLHNNAFDHFDTILVLDTHSERHMDQHGAKAHAMLWIHTAMHMHPW